MSNDEIRSLLVRLREEMQQAELDAETRALIKKLDTDIHDLLESAEDDSVNATVLKRARELEANFETEHPVAARFLREVIDGLARMGI